MTEWNGGAGPRIVAIGGGTGLSTMLRGLKSRTRSLTAIVCAGTSACRPPGISATAWRPWPTPSR